ncbi:MAG: gfo/Idh/MocA family oxidoreductase, partial [Planctomycetales bacterium]|nr:gfo/Idh/MocA family oxidoreductase [Planctomycetales bacterium]
DPVAWLSPGNPFDPASRTNPRVPITSAGLGKPETQPELIASVHDHVLAVRDLIEVVDHNREPLCNARQGATAVEMTCSVFESHCRGGAFVPFPLAERGNPLSNL